MHTVEIREEDGTVLERFHDTGEIAALVAEVADDQSFCCLRFVDPFGTTMFNSNQAGELAIEITRRADPNDVTVAHVVEMADRVAGEVGQFLWLLGD
jgi:hypothetical protein